jgi:biotin/methionine sulfoxide reductase
MRRVIDPVGQARNDFDIFAELGERLGFGAAYTEGRDEMAWLAHMYDEAAARARKSGHTLPAFDAFWDAGMVEFPEPAEPEIFLGAFRADPERHRLATPSGRIELFSNTIAGFGYDDCPPHPAWLEPSEWLGGALTARFPLHLLSNQPVVRLHSQLDPARLSRQAKIAGREPLLMTPADAAARGLAAGDVVRVFNDRGAFLAGVKIVDHLRPGVVQIATGAWYDPLEPGTPGSLDKHGNPNLVTGDTGSSRLGQSSIAQTVLVEVEPYTDAPPVTAFEPPPLTTSA